MRLQTSIAAVLMTLVSSLASAAPPAQRLPSAILVYPYVVAQGGAQDTLIELVNLSRRPTTLHCFYIDADVCSVVNFYVTLTPNQPLSWVASDGTINLRNGSAVPPFFGTGELKCIVTPERPELEEHNTVQGRALVYGSDGQTLGYGAVGFQRLSPGEFDGSAQLNGSEYAQCPDELHFAFVASDAGAESELILVPCSEDLENLIPANTTVQFRVINEFEQHLSASINFSCYSQRLLRQISSVFTEPVLGSESGHLVVRSVHVPVMGMIIDRLATGGALSTSANEPFLRGGRSATIVVP